MEIVLRRLAELPARNDVCGIIKELTTSTDAAGASVAHAAMTAPSIPHYHQKRREFYYVLEGHPSKLVVGSSVYQISPGTVAVIPPGVVHYTIPDGYIAVLAITTPAWAADDQLLPRMVGEAGFDPTFELYLLREEAIHRTYPGEEVKAMSIEELRRLLDISK